MASDLNPGKLVSDPVWLTPISTHFLLFIKQHNSFIIKSILFKGQMSLYLYMLPLQVRTQLSKSLAR